MKKLGLVGGMGPESTIPYYHDIVYGVQERIGKDYFPNLTIESINVFDRLQELSPIPLISIIESTCKEAEKRNLKKIGLLGTIFTMTEDFFKQPFFRKEINIVVPSDVEMEYVNQKISSELEHGILKKETLEYFKKIIFRMQTEENIEAIILGCTELPLLLNDEVSPVPCLDTMQIHIQDIINMILE